MWERMRFLRERSGREMQKRRQELQETVCNYIAACRHFFDFCPKRTDGRFTDLVGVPDHGAYRMSGRIRVVEEN